MSKLAKKVTFKISEMSSDDIYAVLDAVESDAEDDLDNLMNDSDTEFILEDINEQTVTEDTMAKGLEAVVHMTEEKVSKETAIKFNWKSRGAPIEKNECILNGDVQIHLEEEATPLDVFNAVVGFDDLVEFLVIESIRYAQQNGRQFEIDKNEMAAFIGVNFIMSLDVQPGIKSYWSVGDILGNSRVKQVMTRTRFEEILQNLHFADNSKTEQAGTEPDKAKKIRPLLSHFNKYFISAKQDSSKQSVDEHMCKFKGKSGMKQYMKNKPIKWGFKLWFRSCAKTGYLFEANIYCGKKSQPEVGLGEGVVLDLTRNLHNYHITIHADNFFTSPTLARMLLNNGIYFIGTARSNRKEMPNVFKVIGTNKIIII